ncbi:hypothetical protein [uncultured Microscilla sp.]|uniref:hypothetical protein n=1 Tax=uncultured Microscilla sp. TaxID=432653 RepID=UPI0026089FE0|nr:hypothetical protein [uncultured Microscilla sp.]
MRYNLDNKRFVTTHNESGLSSAHTIFHYFQEGDTIRGSYKGGEVKTGVLVGKQTAPNQIVLRFQCITQAGILMSGQSEGTIGQNGAGLLTLEFSWRWLDGDQSGGISHYIEIV